MFMLKRTGLVFVMAMGLSMAPMAGDLHAITAPPAGTVIGNQASATYRDNSGSNYTAVSNTVVSVVQQVASLTLAAPGSKSISYGNTVYFHHTLTNIGNGSDGFSLSLTNRGSGDDFDLGALSIYPDRNGDGMPDSLTSVAATLATGSLAPDGVFRFIVAGTAPGTVTTPGKVSKIVVTAVSGLNATVTASNENTATLTGNAVIRVDETLRNSGSNPDGPYIFSLVYTNTGNAPATQVVLTAIVPTDLAYQTGSGKWGIGNSTTVLTDAPGDAQGTTGNTIDYNHTAAAKTITAIIGSVAPGQSGTVSFNATVNANVPAKTIDHKSAFTYHDGSSAVGPFDTNTVSLTLQPRAGVLLSSPAPITSTNQGSTVSFTDTVTNEGTVINSFDITLGTSTFPPGTTFQLYRSDGKTPLIDTNGNGIPDTGNLAPNGQNDPAGRTDIVIKAILPPGASGVGPYQIDVMATSFVDPTKKATSPNILNEILANGVDVSNPASGSTAASGIGIGPEPTPQRTNATDPGTTTRFTLSVKNTGPATDTYDLSVATALPAGWTAVFKDPRAGEAPITNTGVVRSNESFDIFADISVPAGETPGKRSIQFSAISPTSGAQDKLHNEVDVRSVHHVIIGTNQTGQVFPGGVVIYAMTLTNNGNQSESGITLATADSQSGWSSVIYEDTNNNGTLDSGDAVITGPISLPKKQDPGATKVLFIKVGAPLGAPLGTTDVTTLSAASSSGTFPTATTTTASTVIAGKIVIQIKQVLDSACDGTPDGNYILTVLDTGVNPGTCIRYEVTGTNVGSSEATNVVISSATPEHTKYHKTAVPAAVSAGTVTSEPVDGAIGNVQATVPAIAPGESVVLTFGVKVNS